MAHVVGIDLGTTNSVVAFMETGKPQVMQNAEGSRTTPSVVLYNPDGDIVVGELAKRQRLLEPSRTIYSVKRFVGCRWDESADRRRGIGYNLAQKPDGLVAVDIGGHQLLPERVQAEVLRKMKQTAEDYLGEPDENGKTVLYFGNCDGAGLSYLWDGAGGDDNFWTFDFPSPFFQKRPRSTPPIVRNESGHGLGYTSIVGAVFALSKFTGKPGSPETMSIKFNNGAIDPATNGKTLSRFIWSAQALVNANFSEGDFLNSSTYPHTHVHYLPDSYFSGSGLLYINNTLYLIGCAYASGHNDKQPVTKVLLFKSTAQTNPTGEQPGTHEIGELWDTAVGTPTTTAETSSAVRRLNQSSAVIFNHAKLAAPQFIQYGKAYADYATALPADYGSNPTNPHVYAMSAPNHWMGRESEMNLARVRLNSIGDPYLWEFYVGLDSSGNPMWVHDTDSGTEEYKKAVPVLYSYHEMGQCSVMYHADSKRYLMTTWTNSDKQTWDGRTDTFNDWGTGDPKEAIGGNFDNRWFLWEAPQPWGPWRKVFTNDYHGRQNDITGLATGTHGGVFFPDTVYGHCGYMVRLIPAFTEKNTQDGGWNIWGLQVGFLNFFSGAKIDTNGNTVRDDDNSEGFPPHPSSDKTKWVEYADYTHEYIKINLDPTERGFSGKNSVISNYQQNTHRRNDFNGTVGAFFQAKRALTITHLGRYYETGNSGVHTLSIKEVTPDNTSNPTTAATPTGTPLATSVDVSMTNLRNMDKHGFNYGKLASPVTLTTDKYYVLVSNETSGGDNFYGKWVDLPNTPTTNPDYYAACLADMRSGYGITGLMSAQVNGSSWDLKLYSTADRSHGGNSMGPLNFLYSTASVKVVSDGGFSQLNNTLSQDWFAGCKFTLDKDMVVTQLGRQRYTAASPNNALKHEVRLIQYDGTNRITIASVLLDMSSGSGVTWGKLETPVRAPAKTEGGSTYTYYLISREFVTSPNQELFYGHSSDSTKVPSFSAPGEPFTSGSVKAGYFDVSGSGGVITPTTTWTDKTWAYQCYGPVNLQYE